MTLFEIASSKLTENFRQQVEDNVLTAWKYDPFFGIDKTISSPYELDDDDYDEFSKTVDEVLLFAKQHQLINARLAVDGWYDSIRKEHTPTVH